MTAANQVHTCTYSCQPCTCNYILLGTSFIFAGHQENLKDTNNTYVQQVLSCGTIAFLHGTVGQFVV